MLVRRLYPEIITETVGFKAARDGKKEGIKKRLQTRDNCTYISKLNMKSALKSFRKHFGDVVQPAPKDEISKE